MTKGIVAPSSEFEFPTIDMAPAKLDALTFSLVGSGVGYRLGAKAVPLSLQAGSIDDLDCSGFVRWAIYHATGQVLQIPDGSVTQHEWVIAQGFKKSSYSSGFLKDGAIRIAFLSPADGGGIGHVMLLEKGETCECYGGHGVGFRDWGSESFMVRCSVYVLTAPQS